MRFHHSFGLKVHPLWILLLVMAVAAPLFAQPSSKDSLWKFELSGTFSLSSFPGIRERSFETVVEQYTSRWEGLLINNEVEHLWQQLPPVVLLRSAIHYDNHFALMLSLPIKKDIESWYRDRSFTNVISSDADLDINMRSESYLSFTPSYFSLLVGRFRYTTVRHIPHSVFLSSTFLHDGLLLKTAPFGLSYTFLFSSLNPWLHRNVNDSSVSEEYRQNHYPYFGKRSRIYSEPVKALVMHRIEYSSDRFTLGLQEMSIIGGKYADLIDISPLAIWHNNFGDGFSNSFAGVDLTIKELPIGELTFELAFDEIRAGGNEIASATSVLSEDSPTTMAYQFHYALDRSIFSGNLTVQASYMYVDANFGNNYFPLLKGTARTAYYSNYQSRSSSLFADVYFADIPIGYYRGPNVADAWLHTSFTKDQYTLSNTFGWLRKGEKDLQTVFTKGLDQTTAPMGKKITELRNTAECRYNAHEYGTFSCGTIIRWINDAQPRLYGFIQYSKEITFINGNEINR